ncbi:MAG TPA: AbrB/MazE/SpoVT family DNA-binding domain-containing protein [Planctomycetota bacterium]|nr:AbrB/MazE/SpoVT family DNA-binding domain-containing protein [Planctomycetota bacterium]
MDSIPAVLTKHGDGYALLLDKELVEQMQIGIDTPLQITPSVNSFVVSQAVDPKIRRAKFERALENVHRKFGRAMKKLAE